MPNLSSEFKRCLKHLIIMTGAVSIFLFFSNFDNLSIAAALAMLFFLVLEMSKSTVWQQKNIEKKCYWRRWVSTYSLGLMIAAGSFLCNLFMFYLIDNIHIGLFNYVNFPFWLELLIAILVIDLERYWYHYIQHKKYALWKMHRVHHGDRAFDFTLVLKAFPLMPAISIIPQGIVLILLGASVEQFLIMMLVLQSSFFFIHANIHIPEKIDRLLRWVIVTPAMHYIHHSDDISDTESNYGLFLSIWDRLFNTYKEAPNKGYDNMQVGLSQYQDDKYLSLSDILKIPFMK